MSSVFDKSSYSLSVSFADSRAKKKAASMNEAYSVKQNLFDEKLPV